MLSRSSIGIAAAAGSLCFLGYCIYFDRKRRSDPDFKRKLKEKRSRASQNKKQGGGKTNVQLPDLSSPEAMQKFFLQEVQIGEDLLAQGEIEEGVEHLSVAVAVCGQPQHLLQVLQQTLPPQVFQLLIQKLPTVNQRLSLSKGPTIKNLEEDDVE
ncbi:mitochondrial import receptor subunit TOM20 homolog [Mytilus galloprovincialis]|uniref:Mitochondrial import receptor subunit TOM20 n=2 Tax=Mytilus TaxID=6548 RepID=A0A8B6EPX9_MYTGA|nr:TOM20 [Mytilus edulis]VDI37236.1 mitochondrial import receptor subunit TOM20 [Mytilus galloprovincialis]